MIPSQGNDALDGIYGTPKGWIIAIDERFPIVHDSCACLANRVTRFLYPDNPEKDFFDESQDALSFDWPILEGRNFYWANPPFSENAKWTEHVVRQAQRGCRILLFIPLARTKYFKNYIDGKCAVKEIYGRPIFDFTYPKDILYKTGKLKGQIKHKKGDPNTDPYSKDFMLCVFGDGEKGTTTLDLGL